MPPTPFPPIRNNADQATPNGVPLNDASAVIEAIERLANPRVMYVADPRTPVVGDDDNRVARPFVILPKGQMMSSVKAALDEYRTAPERIVGTATLQDEASFVRHFLRFRNAASAIFCNVIARPVTFSAVFDYHDRTAFEAGGVPVPAFGHHRAIWPLKLSTQYETWHGKNEHWLSHAEFAEFLEQNATDLYQGADVGANTAAMLETLELKLATPSNLIALSRNLQVNVNATVRSAQTLATGEIHMTYAETHNDGSGQPIRVPNAFLIAIPIVHRGPAYQVLCRLRYRTTQQGVRWSYSAHRLDVVFDAAVDEIVSRVGAAADVVVTLGTSEA